MAASSTSSAFVAVLNPDIRYMIYDLVVLDQKLNIISPKGHRTDLNSLSLSNDTVRLEIEAWYARNKRRLHKHTSWGIIHAPSSPFILDISNNMEIKLSHIGKDGYLIPAVHSLTLQAETAWRAFTRDEAIYGILERLVIDVRFDPSIKRDLQNLFGRELKVWFCRLEKLRRCDIMLTQRQLPGAAWMRTDLARKTGGIFGCKRKVCGSYRLHYNYCVKGRLHFTTCGLPRRKGEVVERMV